MDHLALLEFENFQSLHKTELKLDPGLNVIVGPSNLGKSAVVRGLKALVKNAPAPGLIREGAKELTVTALFSDADDIDLIKSKTKSIYYVNGEAFAKAGAYSVPQAVADIWNISDPDLVFASQHDPPFLLSESASQVAQTLGELTNVSVLMEAVQRANKLRTQTLGDEKARLREAEEAREELLSHAGLSRRVKLIEAARQAFTAAQQAVSEWRALVELEQEYQKVSTELEEVEALLSKNISLENLLADCESKTKAWAGLEQLLDSYASVELQLADNDQAIKSAQQEIDILNQQIEELMQNGCPLCERPF